MNPTIPAVSREFTDPTTGRTWTLAYTCDRSGHTVEALPPFAHPLPASRVTFSDVREARELWKFVQRSLVREGFQPVPA